MIDTYKSSPLSRQRRAGILLHLTSLPGTGLGLASVFGIVKNHKGFVNVESSPGKGSLFTIYLPASSSQPPKAKPAPRKQEVVRGSETIMVIDDEEYICEAFNDLLKAMGYDVIVCQVPNKALEIIKDKRKKIDLAIVDMVMPGMDGEELFDKVMQIRPEMKVIIASGYTKDERVEAIVKKGAAGFIQKPFDPATLSEAIRTALASKQ